MLGSYKPEGLSGMRAVGCLDIRVISQVKAAVGCCGQVLLGNGCQRERSRVMQEIGLGS